VKFVGAAYRVGGEPEVHSRKIYVARRKDSGQLFPLRQFVWKGWIAIRNNEAIVRVKAFGTDSIDRDRTTPGVRYIYQRQGLAVILWSTIKDSHVVPNDNFYPCPITEEIPQLHRASDGGHDSRIESHYAPRNRYVKCWRDHYADCIGTTLHAASDKIESRELGVALGLNEAVKGFVWSSLGTSGNCGALDAEGLS
jgi:hypothetical protein